MSELKLTVNGKLYQVDVSESKSLADVLREDLKLTGTKIGCGEAECGICTVIIDGTPVTSCIYPAFKAQGASIETIEGLAEDEKLHPLQTNFIEQGAVQCGFCTPGVIMTSKALLDENPNPSENDIKDALKDTLCRCTGYTSIVHAVQSAGAELRGEKPSAWDGPETKTPLYAIGQPIAVPGSIQKVTGEAMFTDDYAFPDMLFARTLRAEYPHAKIHCIDTSAAKALPGVHAVLTHEDIPGEKYHGLVQYDWQALAIDKVRYMGDPVAIVAADTEEIAAAALDLIKVDYEPLPAITDPEDSHRDGAIVLHDNWKTDNLIKHIKVRHGDIDEGFAQAEVVVEGEYRTPTIDHAFMEPECAIGVPKGVEGHDKLTVYVGSQIPYQDRHQIARVLGVPEDAVRVRGTLIGGGFGGKEDIAGQIHVALLANVTGKPVKMAYTRQESLLAHPKRHATILRIKTGAKKDGTLVAVKAELFGDGGAYESLSQKVMGRATTHATGPYNVPHARVDCFAMYTNNPPSGAFRGFGVTQSAFAVEQNMDKLAKALNMDPIELRRKNAQTVGIETATGQLLRESVGLKETIDAVEKGIKAHQFNGDGAPKNFKWAWKDGKKTYAWGFASAYKNTGLGGGAPDKAEAQVEVYENSTAEVRISSADMGQGLTGVLAQVVSEELNLPLPQVSVLLSDTDLTPDGGPTTASRQTFVSGNAARMAAGSMREALARIAAEEMDVAPDKIRFEEGLLRYNGTSVPIGKVAGWMKKQGLEPKTNYEYWAPETKPLGTGGDMHVAFSYASQAALIEIDTETGKVKVLDIYAAHDVGRAINPKALEGQVEGGIVMSLGNTLTEAFIIEDGVPWSTQFARYKIPSIKYMPKIHSIIVEDPVSTGPYGAKGVGEISSIGAMPAVCNAIFNAVGVRVHKVPVDQDALARAIKDGKSDIYESWEDVK